GHINVYSELGRGTTFRLYFPVSAPGAIQEGNGQSAAQESAAKGEGETILVVEDNPSLLRIVVKQLTDLGYRVLQAETARKALDALNSGQPIALLFTDVVMPGGMDGCELAREAIALRPSAKVLLTSGFPGTSLDGMDDLGEGIRLLSKPYRKEELTRTVR